MDNAERVATFSLSTMERYGIAGLFVLLFMAFLVGAIWLIRKGDMRFDRMIDALPTAIAAAVRESERRILDSIERLEGSHNALHSRFDDHIAGLHSRFDDHIAGEARPVRKHEKAAK